MFDYMEMRVLGSMIRDYLNMKGVNWVIHIFMGSS